MNSFERYIQVLVCCGGQASCCGAASLSLAPSYLAQSFGDSFLPSPWLLYAFPLLHPSPPCLSSSFHFLPISSNYLPIAVNKISQNILYFSPFYGWAVWEGMSSVVLSWGLHQVAVRCLLGPWSSEAPWGWKLIPFMRLATDLGSQVDLFWGCQPEHMLGPPQHGCLRATGPLTWQLPHAPPETSIIRGWSALLLV